MIPEFSSLEDDKKKLNRFISGDYFITSVRHIYNHNSGYRTVMECAKTCYENPIDKV